MKKLMMILRGERPLIDVIHYIVGTFRYKLYYAGYTELIRRHILEQINFRIRVMDKECYNNGECKMCGCQTTALQMANKSCDKPCYPKMMNKKKWEAFYHNHKRVTQGDNIFFINSQKRLEITNWKDWKYTIAIDPIEK